ncbi:MAG: GAF domain-containing protein, partial [Aggregatilineales bacterium]
MWAALIAAAAVGIGTGILSASTADGRGASFTLGDVLYFSGMYLVLAALGFPIFGRLRAGTEGIAVLAAFFSLGLLGALMTLSFGHLSYELLVGRRQARRSADNLLKSLALAALNIGLLSLALTLAAGAYFDLGGALPLATFEPTHFDESAIALIVYTVVALTSKFALACALSTPAERRRFDVRKLRFTLFQGLAHLLALIVAVVYVSNDPLVSFISAVLPVIAAVLSRNIERDYSAVLRRVDALATLNAIGQTLSRDLTVDDLVENLYAQVSRLMDASIFYVALYDAPTEQVSFSLCVREGARIDCPPASLRDVTLYIVKTGKPLLLCGSPEETDAQLRTLGIERHEQPSRCYLGVPLIAENAVLGVIAVQSLSDPDAYDQDDQAVLEIVAAQAAAALQNIRLYQNLLGFVNKLTLLNDVSARMISNFDQEALLGSASYVLRSVGGAHSVAIFLLDSESQTFSLRYNAELLPESLSHFSAACEASLRAALSRSAPILIEDVAKLPAEDAWRSYAAWAGCQSLLALPLHPERQPIGVAVAHYQAPPRLDPSALGLLTAFANQLAVSLSNARHHADTERRAQELAQLVDASRTFATSLDLPHIAERLFDNLERLFTPATLTVLRLAADGALELIASRSRDAAPIAARFALAGGFAEALRSRQSCLLPRSAEDSAALEQLGYAQALVIPMVNDAQAF